MKKNLLNKLSILTLTMIFSCSINNNLPKSTSSSTSNNIAKNELLTNKLTTNTNNYFYKPSNKYSETSNSSSLISSNNYIPSPTSTTAPSAVTGSTADISELATFNGKIYDKSGSLVDGATITAKSIDPAVTWSSTETTINGNYIFRNAPVGAILQITVTKDGVSRTRVEVLKSNLQGDPTANTFDFGGDKGNNYEMIAPSDLTTLNISYDDRITFDPNTQITIDYVDYSNTQKNVSLKKYYKDGSFIIPNVKKDSKVTITIKKVDGSTKNYDYIAFNPENKIRIYDNSFSVLALKKDDFVVNPEVNPFIDTKKENLSTFSIDVDTASYTMMRKMLLEENKLPAQNSVRTEEFLNYFDYGYKEPTSKDKFNIITDIATSPVGKSNKKLLRIGLKSKSLSSEERKPTNLTFVIDISGSMASEERLPAVKKSLEILLNNLNQQDKVGIVVYGSTARVLMEHLDITHKDEIIEKIKSLNTEGATNTEAGLIEGFNLAAKFYKNNYNNRVILCSDGMANVGITNQEELVKKLKTFKEGDIGLTTIGFGIESYNDSLMEALANKMDGSYAYVDNMQEAYKIFLSNLNGILEDFARDVKIQVDFNSKVVKNYRLLGYENKKLANEDFKNDKVDAGEVGLNTSVTALYELELDNNEVENKNKIGTISLRYKLSSNNGLVSEQNKEFFTDEIIPDFNKTSPSFKLAGMVALYAEILRNSYWNEFGNMNMVINTTKELQEFYNKNTELQEFITLAEKANKLLSSEKNSLKNF
ncbi:MAG: von Willebrand factor type A domain-containing protein [Candidatus Sericytochromatia bacterium]